MRLYGPLFIRGLNFWQLGGGSYWGHNALIRLKPFSEFCELPALPGREPFGGRILSHDFVEAALMVAEGWEVWLAWDIEGTYEEAPPTLVDHLIRDRRWCQGNLQHLWLIFARKLPFSVRMHLFMGIMAYLGSPLWFLFLLLGTWVAWDRYSSELSQLPFESYVDRWFHINGIEQSLILTAVIFALLFLPKILAVTRAHPLAPASAARSAACCPSSPASFLETIVSMLLAPCIMAAHTLMVLSIILGRAVGWGNQNRETDGTSWGDAIRFHAFPTLLGIAWTVLALNISPVFAAWMSPILLGLLLVRAGLGLDQPLALRQGARQAPDPRHPGGTQSAGGHPPRRPGERRRRSRARRLLRPPATASSPPSSIPTSTASMFRCSNTPRLPKADEVLAERCLTLGPAGLVKKRTLRATLPCPGHADDAPCGVAALRGGHPFRLDPGRGKLPPAS